jgi:hypothetical protein
VLEAGAADLALQDAELGAGGESLGEQGVVELPTLDEGVEQGPEQGV